MKSLVIVFVIFFTIHSCKEDHHMATKLCDCYTQLHSANSDEEIYFWTDSCNSLYIEILKKLEGDISEKQRFNEAYRRCQ